MATLKDFKSSRFLTKDDCQPPILRTISRCVEENIAKEGQQQFEKVLYFQEPDSKPLILKLTNYQLIAGFLAIEDTDNWGGKRVVLYNDPTVRMAGKGVIGGIRARAPKTVTAAAPGQKPMTPPPAAQAAADETEDDIPY